MSKFRPRQRVATVLAILGMVAAGGAEAAPEDEFLRAEPTTGEFTRLRAEVSYDAVNSTLDIFKLRTRQGPAPENAGDYKGARIMIAYKFSPYWSGAVTYWRRNIDYGQDTNSINSWQLALNYDPLAEPGARDRAIFRFSLWGDYAGTLSKTSPTQVQRTTFNQIRVSGPMDVQAQADAIFSGQLDDNNTLTVFAGVGLSRVSVGDLNAQLRRGNCNFNVHIGSDNIANGTLSAPCQAGNTTLQDATFSVDAAQFGLNVNQDLNYTAGFLNLGGSWRWRYKHFGAQVGYQFQYLIRSHVDNGLSNYGVSPIKSNHTLGLELTYEVVKNVELFVRGQAFMHNFVGTIPFLYNGATAGRLNRYYGYASFGVRFSGF
ncbi:hypothetical protein I6G56_11020 [Burkholderia humptydooensis]|uniref:Uncharacterized protein n=1 Tax=Burkholderia humptydooensis TaxID=430531 RepID=A0A7U4P416_9BURK|nr:MULTISPECIES: hypothetical protein [Burkholderia]AJY41432.1 putative lipoprotein [Burkholderia sp. 2002721687]ALX42605.1 hypothetical protein AQ610_09390 [Burkholderia humptydooensis]QPS42168.1 hypothetical protein I6G56_11020 [Burkholderia humptydooensis]